MAGVAFAPDGLSGGGDPAPVVAAVPDPAAKPDAGSVLYPDDPAKPAGDPDPAKPAGDPAPAEWKEYEPDAAKSDEENAAAKAEHDAKKPAAGDKVPEDGKYALTMPDGIEVDQTLLDAVSPRFKELGLTQKQAQALTDDFIKVQSDRAKAQGEAWANTLSEWVETAKKDPEIGGAKWDSTVKSATSAIAKFGNPALAEYLNSSGGGNNPEMIRAWAKVGAAIGEDKPAISETPGGKATADTATILYPDDQPKGK